MKYLLLFFAMQLTVQAVYSGCSVPKPTGLYSTGITSCSVTMEWGAAPGAAYYNLWYEKKGSGTPITINAGSNTSYVATGLSSNKQYSFKVEAFCSNGTTKGYSAVVKVTTLTCSVVTNPTASTITSSTASISWQSSSPCVQVSFKVRYRISFPQSPWILIQNVSTTTVALSSLHGNTQYEVQVASNCSGNTSAWSSSVLFQTLKSRPNVLFILEDDGRYDTFQSTGGPSFFQTPAINRIANEGINFTYMLPATSQCIPSRCSFYTGLYPHKHGAINNLATMTPGLPLIQQILHDDGYYTGFLGKYGQNGTPPGFDWYAKSTSLNYFDPTFSVNGVDVTSNNDVHYTQAIQNYALRFLDSVPQGKPFLLFYFTIVPHLPTVPRVQDKHLYQDDTMPFPSNFYEYTKNYPSYLYHPGTLWPVDTIQTDSNRRAEFETMKGLDYSVDTLFQYLEEKGILDSTIVIFSSDNGYLKGEHLLEGKEIAYEESIRLPLFIRYPKWFTAGTVISDEIASNIDLAPTLLEAAGIPDTFHMDGVSFHQLATHSVNRKDFLYEFPTGDGLPAIRAVRSLQYKYVKSFCNSTTEEFFDVLNDPHEDTNLVNKSGYSTIIQIYRNKLDSLRTAFSDVSLTSVPCFLKNPILEEQEKNSPPVTKSLTLFPNPATYSFLISTPLIRENEMWEAEVHDLVGRTIIRKSWTGSQLRIDCSGWSAGNYLVAVKSNFEIYFSKIVVLDH